jgi:hypothetical protein
MMDDCRKKITMLDEKQRRKERKTYEKTNAATN